MAKRVASAPIELRSVRPLRGTQHGGFEELCVSLFRHEMGILFQHTDRSLIILDEIGRGTSTYDGLSIACVVVEHLRRGPERGPRTLFATHYQELTQLEKISRAFETSPSR